MQKVKLPTSQRFTKALIESIMGAEWCGEVVEEYEAATAVCERIAVTCVLDGGCSPKQAAAVASYFWQKFTERQNSNFLETTLPMAPMVGPKYTGEGVAQMTVESLAEYTERISDNLL